MAWHGRGTPGANGSETVANNDPVPYLLTAHMRMWGGPIVADPGSASGGTFQFQCMQFLPVFTPSCAHAQQGVKQGLSVVCLSAQKSAGLNI